MEGSFQQIRPGFVGNQASSSIYPGGTFAVYHAALRSMRERKFEDTGRPLGTGLFQREFIGDMLALRDVQECLARIAGRCAA